MRNPTFVVNPKIQIGISDRRKRRNAGIQKGHHEIARPGRPQPRLGACQLQYAVEWYGRQVLTRIEGDLRDTGGAIEKS